MKTKLPILCKCWLAMAGAMIALAGNGVLADSSPVPKGEGKVGRLSEVTVTESPAKPKIFPYRFRQTEICELLDAAGKVTHTETKVKEVFPVGGQFLFHRLVSCDGKPLSAKEREAEEKRLAAVQRAVRDGKKPKDAEELTDLAGHDIPSNEEQMKELEQAVDVEAQEPEEVNGRLCECYQFRGRPGRKLQVKGQHEKFFETFVNGIEGQFWIDQKEEEPARAEIHLTRPLSFTLGGVVLVRKFDLDVDFKRLEPERWFQENVRINFDLRFLYLFNFRGRFQVLNDNFVKVESDSTSTPPER